MKSKLLELYEAAQPLGRVWRCFSKITAATDPNCSIMMPYLRLLCLLPPCRGMKIPLLELYEAACLGTARCVSNLNRSDRPQLPSCLAYNQLCTFRH